MTLLPSRDPAPMPTPLTAPFWDAVREGRLLIQQCQDCLRHVFYPRPICPFCSAERLEWRECSGRGTLLSSTINHRPAPVFSSPDPQVIALVTLEEGVRVTGRIVGPTPAPPLLRLGMPLVAVWGNQDATMLRFTPVEVIG